MEKKTFNKEAISEAKHFLYEIDKYNNIIAEKAEWD